MNLFFWHNQNRSYYHLKWTERIVYEYLPHYSYQVYSVLVSQYWVGNITHEIIQLFFQSKIFLWDDYFSWLLVSNFFWSKYNITTTTVNLLKNKQIIKFVGVLFFIKMKLNLGWIPWFIPLQKMNRYGMKIDTFI